MSTKKAILTMFGCRKGGTGKTTMCVLIGVWLATTGKRVLIVDTDPQSNVAYALGLDVAAPGTAELLLGDSPTPLKASVDNLDVLPGSPRFDSHEIRQLEIDDLSIALKPFTSQYDHVLIDSPPVVEFMERMSLRAADKSVLVLDSHPFALVGAARVINEIKQFRKKQKAAPRDIALVLNRFQQQRQLDRDVEGRVIEHMPDLPRFRVRQNVLLAKSTATGASIFQTSDQGAKASEDLGPVANWVAKPVNVGSGQHREREPQGS